MVHVLLGLVLAAVPAVAQTDAHLYSPGTNLERSELAQLESATRTVDVAMYSFTDRGACRRVGDACSQQRPDRVYRDREQFQQEAQGVVVSTIGILLAAAIEVRVKGARNLMHLKSYAIDGRLLRSGSANWSPTGLKRQDNDVLYDASPEAVARFEAKFEEMWARAANATGSAAADH